MVMPEKNQYTVYFKHKYVVASYKISGKNKLTIYREGSNRGIKIRVSEKKRITKTQRAQNNPQKQYVRKSRISTRQC